MESNNPMVYFLAKKNIRPVISLTDGTVVDILNAKIKLEISDDKISKFIIDFSKEYSSRLYNHDFALFKKEIENIESIRINESLIFNEFVQNFNLQYKLSDQLMLQIKLPESTFESRMKLTGKKHYYLHLALIKSKLAEAAN